MFYSFDCFETLFSLEGGLCRVFVRVKHVDICLKHNDRLTLMVLALWTLRHSQRVHQMFVLFTLYLLGMTFDLGNRL